MNNKNSKNDIPQKNITVSIILSESTASLFHLDIPHLDSSIESCSSSESNVCSIKPITNLKELLENQSSQTVKTENNSLWSLVSKEYNKDSNKIIEDIAYMSHTMNDSDSSIEVDDDLSNESLQQRVNQTNDNSLKLDAVKVYTRPLVAVKSRAHENNLNAEENKILINSDDNDLNTTESGWINVCRICHGGLSIGNLLAPCRCKGSIALTHLNCLERWLRESSTSRCELCQYRYRVIRKPKYSIPRSIFVFLKHPGEHFREILIDLVGFTLYTPSAVASTYMLMLLCDTVNKQSVTMNRNLSSNAMAFVAIFGIAAIDFVYSSWLIITFQKHADAWRTWYRSNCEVKLILPPWKRKYICRRR